RHAAGGVDDRERRAVARKPLQAGFDLVGAVNGLDQQIRDAAATLPSRKRPLLVGLDQANNVAGLPRGQRKADGERALAAAAFLGGQYDRLHCWSPLDGFKGSSDTPY